MHTLLPARDKVVLYYKLFVFDHRPHSNRSAHFVPSPRLSDLDLFVDRFQLIAAVPIFAKTLAHPRLHQNGRDVVARPLADIRFGHAPQQQLYLGASAQLAEYVRTFALTFTQHGPVDCCPSAAAPLPRAQFSEAALACTAGKKMVNVDKVSDKNIIH